MDVRAAVAAQAGKPLEIMTVQLDGPRAGEVLVEVKATGICHTDDFRLSGADPEGIFLPKARSTLSGHFRPHRRARDCAACSSPAWAPVQHA
jgi:Zn-dependent alcohol dehydrogenase